MKYFFSGLMIVIAVVSCNEEDEVRQPYGKIQTKSVSKITSHGVTFNGELSSHGTNEIETFGFVWSKQDQPVLSDDSFVELKTAKRKFNYDVRSGLINNQKYYVRAFIKYDELIVYGKSMSFTSLGSRSPKIDGIQPLSGTIGDTILISGEFFINNNSHVLFGNKNASIVSLTDSLIKCIVPPSLTSNDTTLKVSADDPSSFGESVFIISKPIIYNIEPSEGVERTEIKIIGENFSHLTAAENIHFNGDSDIVALVSSSKTELVFYAPRRILNAESEIKVTLVSKTGVSPNPFRRVAPLIIDFSPKAVNCGEQVTIIGENFPSSFQEDGKLFLGDLQIADSDIISHSTTEVSFNVPDEISGSSLISIEIIGLTTVASEPLKFVDGLFTGMIPYNGTDSDEILLLGEDLPLTDNVKVYFNTLEATIIEKSASQYSVIVPPGIVTSTATVTVEVNCVISELEDQFQMNAPIIDDFSPKSGSCEDIITIRGSNFSTTGLNNVYFDDIPAILVESSATELKAYPPSKLSVGNLSVKVKVAEQVHISNDSFSNLNFGVCDLGLVAYYPFNGNALDESVNSNNGTVSGATLTMDRFSNSGSAYSFDGVNDYILLGDDYDLSTLTINIWFKASNIEELSGIFFASDHSRKAHGLVVISVINDGLDYLRFTRNGEQGQALVQGNTWYMATIVIDENTYSYYLDGMLVLSSTDNGNVNSQDGVDVAIIGTSRKFNRHFAGGIDDIRIYDRVLNDAEIAVLFNETP